MGIRAASTFLTPDWSWSSVLATVVAILVLTMVSIFIIRSLVRRA